MSSRQPMNVAWNAAMWSMKSWWLVAVRPSRMPACANFDTPVQTLSMSLPPLFIRRR